MFKLDDLLKDLGEFGPYQKKVFGLICFIVFFNSWSSMIQVFLAASVDHWCATPEWECVDEELSNTECELLKKEGSIPSNYTSDGELEYAQCEKYNVSGVGFWPGIEPSNYSSGPLSTIECDQGWVFDTSQYKSSIATDFELVCGKEDLIQVSQSVYFGGYFVGSLVLGSLADIIGRWWSLMICIVLRLVSGIALAFSPNWWVFTVIRFAQGCAAISMYIIAFIIANEFTGPSRRNIVGIIIVIPFAAGYVCLALLAYFLRYWRTLEIVATVPVFGMIVVMYWIPESVRWQISKGKYDKAEKTIAQIAKSNKKSIPSPIFESKDSIREKKSEEREPRQHSMVDLFRTPNLRKRSINLAFIWMVNAVVYHGLSLSTSNLGVNDYVAFAVAGAIEIPSYIFASFVIEVFGRPRSLSFLLILSGVSLLATSVVPPGPGLVTVAMIGKFGIAAAFAIVFLYTVELYPTSFRSSAMGAFSMFSRVAGIISPLVLTLAKYWRPLPLVIYGAAGLAVGLSTLLLPETRGMKLPETLEEGENFGKKYYHVDNDGTEEEKEAVKTEKMDEAV